MINICVDPMKTSYLVVIIKKLRSKLHVLLVKKDPEFDSTGF